MMIATLLVVTAGCSGGGDGVRADGAPDPTAADRADQASGLQVRDAWVKSAESGMSAAFGILVNEGDEDVVVVAATSDASPIMELHETVEDLSGEVIMREKDGGFVVPAGGRYLLQPGANHLMLMDLERPVVAGEEVRFALALADGSNLDFAATAKDYSGANERYVPSQ